MKKITCSPEITKGNHDDSNLWCHTRDCMADTKDIALTIRHRHFGNMRNGNMMFSYKTSSLTAENVAECTLVMLRDFQISRDSVIADRHIIILTPWRRHSYNLHNLLSPHNYYGCMQRVWKLQHRHNQRGDVQGSESKSPAMCLTPMNSASWFHSLFLPPVWRIVLFSKYRLLEQNTGGHF